MRINYDATDEHVRELDELQELLGFSTRAEMIRQVVRTRLRQERTVIRAEQAERERSSSAAGRR